MAHDFLFGFKFVGTNYVSPMLQKIEHQIESINTQVKNTARWREAGANIAVVGGGVLAAGGAVALMIKSTTDAASGMQNVMSHVATAMNDGAAQQVHLAQALAMSEKASIASGIAATQEAQAYYTARSNSLDHAQALAAVNTATKLVIGTTASLSEAQAQLDPTTRLLTGVYQTFGDKTKNAVKQIATYGDQLSKLQTHYAFRGQDEINNAMAYAVPLSKAAGVAFTDQNAALALLSLGLKHGAEAGTTYQEVVSKLLAGGKLKAYTAVTAQGGIDFGKTIARLHAATIGLSAAQRGAFLHQVGFTERSIQGVAILIDKTDQYRSVVADLSNSQGANAAAFATRQAAPDVTWGRLSAALDVLRSKIGAPLLGPMLSLVNDLTSVAASVANVANEHQRITKYIVTFGAIGAAIAIVGGGLLVMTGAIFASISYLPAMTAVTAGLGGAFSFLGGAATFAWTAITGPVGLVVAAIAAVAIATYELYEHWAAVKAFLMSGASWAYAAGANLVKAIASGIWSAITFPQHAIEAVVGKIWNYLPHSPAKEGPLRTLHRVRIVEEIARSIQPGPALLAMRRTAAAVAIAAPMVLSPMMAGPAMAGASGGARGGGITIQVHQEIHIDGATAGDDREVHGDTSSSF